MRSARARAETHCSNPPPRLGCRDPVNPYRSPALPVADQPFSSLATPSAVCRSRPALASLPGARRPPSPHCNFPGERRNPRTSATSVLPVRLLHLHRRFPHAGSACSPKSCNLAQALAQGDLHPASDCPPGPNRANPANLPHPTQSLRPPSHSLAKFWLAWPMDGNFASCTKSLRLPKHP